MPQIEGDPNGNFIVVWHQGDGSVSNAWANRYVDGTSWGTAGIIDQSSNDAEAVTLAVDTYGNAFAIWMEETITWIYDIVAVRYVYGQGWEGTTVFIETGAGNAQSPQVDFDSSGNAIAVWQQYDGTRYNIWANQYTN